MPVFYPAGQGASPPSLALQPVGNEEDTRKELSVEICINAKKGNIANLILQCCQNNVKIYH